MESKIRVVIVWLSILLIAMVSGCTSVKGVLKQSPKARPVLTEGMIVVSHPEVFSYSRLLKQNQQDKNLLEQKLDAYDPGRFQALREIRVFKSISEIAEATKAPANSAADQPETTPSQQETEPAAASEGNDSDAQQKASPPPPPAAAPETNAVNDSDRELPDPGQLIKTRAQPTNYDQVLDELVYRDMINSELRSIGSDDSLGLMGYTIYSLNFKITVVPGINTYTLGEAALTMATSNDVSKSFFRCWQQQLQTDLVEEAFGIQSRWYSSNLSDREKLTLQQSASQLRHRQQDSIEETEAKVLDLTRRKESLQRDQKEKSATIERLEAEIRQIDADLANIPKQTKTLITRTSLDLKKGGAQKQIQKLRQQIDEIDVALSDDEQKQIRLEERGSALKRKIETIDRFASDVATARAGSLIGNQIVLCDIIRDRYIRQLNGLVSFSTHSQININGTPVYFPQLQLNPDRKTEAGQFEQFQERLRGLKLQPYVHRVEPRQYAQNISETTARHEMTPGQKNLLLIQRAITRKPLAVGYARGATQFGWILGPRQEVDEGGNPLVRHLPIQYNFQVQLTVPAWLESIRLAGKYFWLSEEGIAGKGADIWNGEIEVKLPAKPQGITSALMKDASLYHPVILPPWDPSDGIDRFYFRQGEKASFMIRGHNLWRHPEVYLGTQRASSVEVMPDLGGLIVSFDRIESFRPRKTGPSLLNLFVVTSRGEAVLKNAVEVLPPEDQKN